MKYFFLFFSLLFSLGISAQESSHHDFFCDEEANQRFKNENPHLVPIIEAAEQQLEAEYQAFLNDNKRKSARSSYVIPIVFHVIHNNGVENISDEQIYDCIDVLNRDFHKRNGDTINIVNNFKSIAANVGVEFRLARLDPSGFPTTGINRIQSQETYVGDDGSKIIYWNRAKYLNVWVVNSIQSGAAGWTRRPPSVAGSPNVDGIMIQHNYVGSIGTGSPGRSRTLTHEIGHWLNLSHPWGPTNNPGLPTNCNSDDGVFDTPNTEGWTSCNLNGTTCGSLDNVQNYMDYSYCTNMFTEGQKARMLAALNSSVSARNNLWKQDNLEETGVSGLVTADFVADNTIICFGDYVSFTDRSAYDQSSWDWSFSGANTPTSSDPNPIVQFSSPGLQTVSLVVSDGVSSQTNVKENFIWVMPEVGESIPFAYDFENIVIPNDNLLTNNPDADQFGFTLNNQVGYQSDRSISLDNYANFSNRYDEFILGPVDVKPLQTMELSFKLAFAQRNAGNNDFLRLKISTDCGQTWSTRWQASGSQLASVSPTNAIFTPSSDADWKEVVITSFTSLDRNAETLLLEFEFQSAGGNNLYIDDIQIDGVYKPVPQPEFPRYNATGLSENTLINWKAVRGVDAYEYQIDNTAAFNSADLQTGTINYISDDPKGSDTEYLAQGLTHGATHYWRVRAITNGTPSAWSDNWIFTVSPNGVSVEEEVEEANALNIYPNPADQNITLKWELASSGNATIKIIDLVGKTHILQSVAAQNLQNGHQLTLGELAPGAYFVILEHNKGREVVRLVIR